jgi:hypothetical protein
VPRRRWRGAESRVVPALFEYALERWGMDHVAHAWDEFLVWPDDGPAFEEAEEYHAMFVPWYVCHFVPDAHAEGVADWPTVPIGRHFLEHTAQVEPDDWLFIARACESPFSFLVVTAVDKTRTIGLRDLFTGRTFTVLEHDGSLTLSKGELVFSAVLSFPDGAILLGTGPYAVLPTWHTRLIDLREHYARERTFGRADLFEYDIELREHYFDVVEAMLHPAPPALTNTDGEPVALTTVRYELRCSPQSAYDRLKPMALSTSDEELLADAEWDDVGLLHAVSIPWLQAGNRVHTDWETTALGTLQIGPGRLVAQVNSESRAARLEQEVARRLGEDAAFVEKTTVDVAELISRSEASDTAGGTPEPEVAPEMREALAEIESRHWDAWFVEPIPALGDLTPRDAARTPEGRERLEALLAEYAWRDQRRPPHARVDLAELRLKLGLPSGE